MVESYYMNTVEVIFAKYDKNGSGVLERDQVKDFLAETTGDYGGLKEEQVEKFLDEVDKDGNGEIDKEELFKYVQSVIESILNESPKK